MPLESLSYDLYFWTYAQNIGRRSLMSCYFSPVFICTLANTLGAYVWKSRLYPLRLVSCWQFRQALGILQRGVFISLHSHFVKLFIVVVLLIVVFITQRKLLNALITLRTMLSLSVGVSFGFKPIKKFYNFQPQ
jgi:hypothetical protein